MSHKLINYKTGTTMRNATSAEVRKSNSAARRDGGRGLIEADGVVAYTERVASARRKPIVIGKRVV